MDTLLEVIPVNKGSLTKTVRTYTKSLKTSPLDCAVLQLLSTNALLPAVRHVLVSGAMI
jgi:hypothetical protein